MSLDGLATAIYQRKDGQHVVSSTQLRSTDDENIFIEGSEVIDIDPSREHTNGRAALMTVLDQIASRRAQIIEIEDKAMLVPLHIVHGVAEKHDHSGYTRMIQGAFPEYFSGSAAPKANASVNTLLEHLFQSHHAARAPKPTEEDEPASQLSLLDFQLFLPDDPAHSAGLHVTDQDHRIGGGIAQILHLAKSGNAQAKQQLTQMAVHDARTYAQDLTQRGILASTRFVQFGLHTEEFQKAPRYTYLEWGDLKDVFVRTLISALPEQHNICMKTPNDKASPAFADITTTFLADVWMLIHFHRTNTPKKFRNVSAKRR